VEQTKQNRLAYENSPYLLQHADNPVDWYPWGDEAFEKARKEDKMIFLSIGYSTCHWCHVMEHESFEDEQVAELMNRAFVPIKVDREDRPDLDSFFMDIAVMLNGSGGWPLNLVLTPEGKPFFAATYIPKKRSMFSAGMLELIPKIEELWKSGRKKIFQSADSIMAAMEKKNKKEGRPEAAVSPDRRDDLIKTASRKAFESLSSAYEPRFGGFSKEPKFPQSHNFLFLLRYWKETGDEKALSMTKHTLDNMRAGGICDQLGFGFHRYSTDMEWKVPHFEKMLYDQAMLLLAYTEMYRVTGEREYAETVSEIYRYAVRELLSPEGGFYTAVDADSEGEEGKYYVWGYEEFVNALKPGEEGFINFFHVGDNILYRTPGTEPPGGRDKLEEVRKRLLSLREKRAAPERDDKVLTNWNGLMIYALARAGWVLAEPRYVETASRALSFLLERMKREDGGLFHRYRNDQAGINGNLDDYAFIIAALLELYRADFHLDRLKEAERLSAFVSARFEDRENGGFYFTDMNTVDLPVRSKRAVDNAIPSGLSFTVENLLRLYQLTGKPTYRESAERAIQSLSTELSQYPSAFAMLLSSLLLYTSGGHEIVITGEEEETEKFIKEINQTYLPHSAVLLKTAENAKALADFAPYTKRYGTDTGQSGVPETAPRVYVCSGFSCRAPVSTIEELKKLLEDPEK
jgi:uncharacterized protein